MFDFLKKNIFIIILSSITLFLGFLTFLTFIDRSFIELNQKNLQYLLVINILLLSLLFIFIFFEVKKSIKTNLRRLNALYENIKKMKIVLSKPQ